MHAGLGCGLLRPPTAQLQLLSPANMAGKLCGDRLQRQQAVMKSNHNELELVDRSARLPHGLGGQGLPLAAEALRHTPAPTVGLR